MPVVLAQQSTGHGLANEARSTGVWEAFEDVLEEDSVSEESATVVASEEVATTVIPSPAISLSANAASVNSSLLLDRSPHIGSGAGRTRRLKATPELQCPCLPAQQAIAPASGAAEAASGTNDIRNDNRRAAPTPARAIFFAR
jgi:hypothetical protein